MAPLSPNTDALLVIDVQPDFMPGGALAVPDGDAVVPVINRLLERMPHAIATQDWHPPGHASFASTHTGRRPFETIELAYGAQTLWPDHCIQGSAGAALHPDLDLRRVELILRKGFRLGIDSYSAFRENDRATLTGLQSYLRERGITRVFLAGLARDYCVQYTAEDALEQGFDVLILEDACRPIDAAAAALQGQRLAERGARSIVTDLLLHG